MIAVEQALSRILETVHPLAAPATVPLADSLGRYAGADVRSGLDLPGFDNSAMDGYAVQSKDLQTASLQNPVRLLCTTAVPAGDHSAHSISSGVCARIFTGSPLPAGADAVVMQEDVSIESNTIGFVEPAKPLENVRLRGEDIRAGSTVLRTGQKLTPSRIALLAATGHAQTKVLPSCRVALLATGNELREPCEMLENGQIYESNRSMVSAFLKQVGAESLLQPIVTDNLQSTLSALESAFQNAELVITTGGVSVGEFDFVKDAFRLLGGKIDLWQIAMRPGKPFVFGRLGGKFLFGLPGNPVSAFVTFLVLVRPAILKMQGAESLTLPKLQGELLSPLNNPGDRRHYCRVRWQNGKISLAGAQKSHMIGSLGEANALVDVPAGARFAQGAMVDALLWELPES